MINFVSKLNHDEEKHIIQKEQGNKTSTTQTTMLKKDQNVQIYIIYEKKCEVRFKWAQNDNTLYTHK